MDTMLTRRSALFFIPPVLLLILSGCPAYKVQTIDYGSPQRKAAIVFGDPQVYARASLINDRRREQEYLQQLLANSAVDSTGKSVVTFSPQLIRDLRTVQALSTNLGLAIGKNSTDTSAAADISQQIAAAKQQTQLAVLQKQLDGIHTASAPQVTIPAPDLSSSTVATTPPTGAVSTSSMPDVSALQTALKNIQSQLTALSSLSPASVPIGTFAAAADPRSDFSDRQAYRREIRAALSEAQLDDTHDRGGNTLYRLQFQATVLPPSDTSRQWGAAKIEIGPPRLRAIDIEGLYIQWLAYISKSLNGSLLEDQNWATAPANTHSYGFDRYLVELGRNGYFDVIDLFWDRGHTYYCLDHRTASEAQLRESNPVYKVQQQSGSPSESMLELHKLGTLAVPPTSLLFSNCGLYPSVRFDITSRALSDDKVQLLLSLFSRYSLRRSTSADSTFASLRTRELRLLPGPRITGETETFVPPDFCKIVVDQFHAPCFCDLHLKIRDDTEAPAAGASASSHEPSTPTPGPDTLPSPHGTNASALSSTRDGVEPPVASTAVASGNRPPPSRQAHSVAGSDRAYAVRSYSVLPSELAQRLGITTESSQSLQIALSVAAQLSAAAKGGLDAGYLVSSEARAQALSRQPLVVGFAGSDVTSDITIFGGSFFGWLFGPEFSVESSKELSLRQSVRTYGLSADVSVPGWWNYLITEISTAWISNWETDSVLRISDKTQYSIVHKRVSLPLSDATYESLTNYVASLQYGPQNAQIDATYVTPNLVPACASSVTFQIGGVNIWRADTVYLGGVKAKAIHVLPDMKGITAEFDMNAVYGELVDTSASIQAVPLTVASQQGSAQPYSIYVVGSRQTVNGVTRCQSPLLTPTTIDVVNPTIVAVAPSEICTDAVYAPLLVSGVNLPDKPALHSAEFELVNWSGDWLRRVLDLKLRKDVKVLPGPLALTLTYPIQPSYQGAFSFAVTMKSCGSAGKADGPDAAPGDTGTIKPAKSALSTISVRLMKDQPVVLRAAIPASYFTIVVSARPKVKTGSWDWINSSPVKPLPGKLVEVSGIIDLSGVSMQAGDKLEVALRIQARPGGPWQELAADKTLTVNAAP